MINVVIVEDSAGIRVNWEKLINQEAGLRCAATFSNGEDALKRIPVVKPHVVIMDINLPRMSGIECAAHLKELMPELQILMVTVHSDNDRVFAALEAGASGYLLKRSAPAELIQSIREVVKGGAPMTGEIARRVINAFRRPPKSKTVDALLTPREEELLVLLTQGYSNKELAAKLNISFDTVRTHLCHIYEKLHVRSRTEAAARYLTEKGVQQHGRPPEA